MITRCSIKRSCLRLFTLPLAAAAFGANEIHLGQGMLVGEVTQSTAIFQSRLTAASELVAGDMPGMLGIGRFEIAIDDPFQNARYSPWIEAKPDGDFILKAFVEGLQPDTLYYYRVNYGPTINQLKLGPVGRFRTLPPSDRARAVSFVLTSCGLYTGLQRGVHVSGTSMKNQPGYKESDAAFPAIDRILQLQPDFCIFNGDCVYYDFPRETSARTQGELRKKWHEQYAGERFLTLFSRVPTYWLKDDHDYRRDDADATGSYAPSHELGIATFREQVPVVNPSDAQAVTYRTHRAGRDLQLWFVEGRDYRSPNAMPDGPSKSLWGSEQKAWLQRTLRESNATYKILVSPTPMIGPDDGHKRDNHVNLEGFRHEGEAFFTWLKESGIATDRFYIVCGDRHWKYHAIHPSGYEEFGSGALNSENARLGRAPGDPKSTDPLALVRQPYTDKSPIGGFLHIGIRPGGDAETVRIEFTHYNEYGDVMYRKTHSTQYIPSSKL